MSKVVCDVTVSLDGFVAGPAQSREHPLGIGAEKLHRWQFEAAEENWQERTAITEAGAFIMGRNMFGPGRGAWDEEWTGWWGSTPPYHAPVFVLTHHERESIEMDGGTTFHFITGGIHAALEAAKDAADGHNVAIAGGAATINQFLNAGLLQELRLHTAPILLGSGERLFDGVSGIDFTPVRGRTTDLVTHTVFRVNTSEEH
ncbi:dihydrofolate reductase family protein [Glutamicibacter sp. MNS18]|uniref:dihydrofolate reductase family protein n=1 Tax=Glutamicibacter sp. MNS18 TaxID=2989817 RepID=UPI0022362745|nr:dihydrofolate reductase family protein [Glutamicibacter sp. MNS18]MCW4467191.1 dihydrofolate reductase family protein [Glutamicibacter sp. MNS18]